MNIKYSALLFASALAMSNSAWAASTKADSYAVQNVAQTGERTLTGLLTESTGDPLSLVQRSR